MIFLDPLKENFDNFLLDLIHGVLRQ
jgi:hypothetical protein